MRVEPYTLENGTPFPFVIEDIVYKLNEVILELNTNTERLELLLEDINEKANTRGIRSDN